MAKNCTILDYYVCNFFIITGLTSLLLWTPHIPDYENGSLLTEMFVKNGLLKMPKLKYVRLSGEFKVSTLMCFLTQLKFCLTFS